MLGRDVKRILRVGQELYPNYIKREHNRRLIHATPDIRKAKIRIYIIMQLYPNRIKIAVYHQLI